MWRLSPSSLASQLGVTADINTHTYTLTQFSSPHRHSLYTTRKDINTRLLFGGKEYFDVLCDTIMAAEHSIMISSCDFMPELYLKRDKR